MACSGNVDSAGGWSARVTPERAARVCAWLALVVSSVGAPAAAQTFTGPRPPVMLRPASVRFGGTATRRLLREVALPPAAFGTLATRPPQASGPQAPGAPNVPGPAPRRVVPRWLAFHGEQRTRFESADNRYRPGEVAGDEILAFRTRLQARVTAAHVLAIAEVQDSRVGLSDSASTLNSRIIFDTQFTQLSAGVVWRNIGRAKLAVQFELGRFSRDYGMGRMISRLIYANTTNIQEGAVAGLSGKTWSVQALALRPVIYTYPVIARDARFWDARFGGIYATSTKNRHLSLDLYLLHLSDGNRFPAATRRQIETPGFRAFGVFGPADRAEYEVEAATQWGDVGPLDHRAHFQHVQVGYNWPKLPFSPRVLGLYDHSTGDNDPTDQKSGAFDTLFGRVRFEMGPTGMFGLLQRSNLLAPGVQVVVRPTKASDLSVQHRWARLDQARDRWRPIGIVDPTGRSGTDLGSQTEMRLRVRWRQYLEFDGGVTRFNDGAFVRRLRPSPNGHTMFYFAGTDWRF